MSSLRGRSIINIWTGNDYVNLFDLTYDVIDAIKKKDQRVKVLADQQIQNLCSEISKLSENVKCLEHENKCFTLVAIKSDVSNIIENRIIIIINLFKVDHLHIYIL